MRLRWFLSGLEVLTLGVVVGIFYWQLMALPSLKNQIISGIESSLEKLARESAEGFSDYYTKTILEGNKYLQSVAKQTGFSAKELNELKKHFRVSAASREICDAWVAVFVNQNAGGITAWEYKLPSRYRPDTDLNGSWRAGTEISEKTIAEVYKVFTGFKSIKDFNEKYWAQVADSTITFSSGANFSGSVFTGVPVYEGAELKGFIFNRRNDKWMEKEFIPEFFNSVFWKGSEEKEGLDRKHLHFGVYSNTNNRYIYNSVAFGRKFFEKNEALAGINTWLSDYTVALGFRNSDSKQVGEAIYYRNRTFLFILFFVLIILVLVIFRASRRLMQLSSMKSEFVANVTHEIKTPLAAIQLAADTLRLGRASTPAMQESCLNIIQKESVRLQEMVQTILDFSQIEAGRKKYRREKVPCKDLCEELTAFVKDRLRENAGEIHLNPPEGVVEIDRKAIQQVLSIYIDNAIKYSKENKRVDFKVRGDGKNLRLEVKDYGIGIAPANLNVVFEKFVRIGNLDVHDVKGHGIGLSIAKAIAKDHKGKVGVESELGKGSTFYLLLPLTEN